MTAKSVGSLVSLDVPIDSPSDMRREVARRVDDAIGGVRPRWDPTAVRARATEVLGLCDEVERLKDGRDAAWDEVERLRSEVERLRASLKAVLAEVRSESEGWGDDLAKRYPVQVKP